MTKNRFITLDICLLIFLLLALAERSEAQSIYYKEILTDEDVSLSPRTWVILNEITTWDQIVTYTGDPNLHNLENIIRSSPKVQPDSDVYLYGLGMYFWSAVIENDLFITISSLYYDSQEDLVIAFNPWIRTWHIIDEFSSGAYIENAYPLTLCIEDDSIYDATPGTPQPEITFIVVIAKVYNYGGGGGCTTGEKESLNLLLLLLPLGLMIFKKR